MSDNTALPHTAFKPWTIVARMSSLTKRSTGASSDATETFSFRITLWRKAKSKPIDSPAMRKRALVPLRSTASTAFAPAWQAFSMHRAAQTVPKSHAMTPSSPRRCKRNHPNHQPFRNIAPLVDTAKARAAARASSHLPERT
eukprot:scaffold148568_cov33-Tisochrysis_lutea.AAC.2